LASSRKCAELASPDRKGLLMNLAYFLGRAWEFLLWFANLIVGTVANSIFGGWNAVIALAVVAFILFLLTRGLVRRRPDD
jgi:hypothetical protein